jgi:hypothetical protein
MRLAVNHPRTALAGYDLILDTCLSLEKTCIWGDAVHWEGMTVPRNLV